MTKDLMLIAEPCVTNYALTEEFINLLQRDSLTFKYYCKSCWKLL